ncbi:CATRA system-associated protein [Streptomyces sp. NPDC003401]
MTPQQIVERVKGIERLRLTPQEWEAMGDVLKSLQAVLAGGDDAEVVRVLARLEPLEQRGAVRRAGARLGGERTPIPPQQQEQRNHLIERLTVDVRGPADRSRDGREGRGTSG